MEQITILHTYEAAYNRVVSYLEKEICPAVRNLASVYNSLDIGKFDQSAFVDAVDNKGIITKELFTEQIESDIKRAKLPGSLLKMMDSASFIGENLRQYDDARNSLVEKFKQYSFSVTAQGEIFSDDVIIKNSLPEIDEGKVLRRFQIVIDTPEKRAIHNQMLNVLAVYDELRAGMYKQNFQFNPRFEDCFTIQENGSIIINPEFFDRFFNPISAGIIDNMKLNSPEILYAAGYNEIH